LCSKRSHRAAAVQVCPSSSSLFGSPMARGWFSLAVSAIQRADPSRLIATKNFLRFVAFILIEAQLRQNLVDLGQVFTLSFHAVRSKHSLRRSVNGHYRTRQPFTNSRNNHRRTIDRVMPQRVHR